MVLWGIGTKGFDATEKRNRGNKISPSHFFLPFNPRIISGHPIYLSSDVHIRIRVTIQSARISFFSAGLLGQKQK
jgi:hypothetical protein